jgi:hypothetical protein
MIKFITLAVIALGAFAAGFFRFYPDDFTKFVADAVVAAQWAWDGIRANPVPVSLAAGTFLLTAVYHKAKGKSLRESLEVAATRVTVVNVPKVGESEGENPVVARAKARATRAQLLVDQIGLQNRQKKLPEELRNAEKDACYTQQALADAERRLVDRRKAHDDAVAKLDALQKEHDAGAAELAEIDVELKKLGELV